MPECYKSKSKAPREGGPQVVEHDEEDRLAIAEEDAGALRPAEETQDPLLAGCLILRPTRRFDPTYPTIPQAPRWRTSVQYSSILITRERSPSHQRRAVAIDGTLGHPSFHQGRQRRRRLAVTLLVFQTLEIFHRLFHLAIGQSYVNH